MHKEVTCAITAAPLPLRDALKLVRGPEGQWVPDLKQTLPDDGGSCYIIFSREVLREAVSRKIVEGVKLEKMVENLLLSQLLGCVGLLKRSGQLLAGYEKIAAALERPSRWACLIQAQDAAPDGLRKIARKKPENMPLVQVLTREELAHASGMPNPVHLLAAHGGLSEQLIRTAHQLEKWRQEN